VALKDLASDLANFKYNQTSPDKVDNQINKGVDFFNDITSGATGFTPKTDLESLYHSVQQGTFGPVGGNVGAYGSLLAGDRTSQFSFPETLGANNIYMTPEGFTGLQTTLNLPRELFRFSTIGPENDTFDSQFSALGLGSQQFKDKIDLFNSFGSGDFTNAPGGLDANNLFSNTSLRAAANTGPHAGNTTHPIIIRPMGSNWDTANSDLEIPDIVGSIDIGLNFGDSLNIDGFSFKTQGARNIADKYRISKFMISPEGDNFLKKQNALQLLNPTLESKFFKPQAMLGVAGADDITNFTLLRNSLNRALSVVPTAHPERHTGDIIGRYDYALRTTGTLEEDSRLAYQARAFTIAIPAIPNISISPFNSSSALGKFGNSVANFAANAAIGFLNTAIDVGAASPFVAFSNPNKYSLFPSSAPISIKNGVPSFGIGLIQIPTDTYDVKNKKGGTFNKSTAQKTSGNLIKRHSTLPYSVLAKDSGYDGRNPLSPSEVNRFRAGKNNDVDDFNVNSRYLSSVINDKVGNPGEIEFGELGSKIDEKLGKVKGDLKTRNVDQINALRYGDDYNPDSNPGLNDFIKFRFKDVVNNKFIIFRAILDGITDSVTPEYGEEKYIGRPDKVYVYQGADRNVSFNFSVYPKTKQEFPIMLEKLNYLVGLCYPSYTEQDMMVTPLIELTLGDMFVNTTGLLFGVSVTVEDNTTWELDDGLQFPHYIKVACEFKHIGNRKLSSTGQHYDLNTNLLPPKPDKIIFDELDFDF